MNDILKIQDKGNIISIPYKVIKSRRQSIGIEIGPGGNVIVRAPSFVTVSQIQSFLRQKDAWILTHYQTQLQSTPVSSSYENPSLVRRYRKAATEYIPKRVDYYLTLTGGHYERITIREQKTRWGSCSSNGTLSFNWRLMLAPPRVLDYVIVHELCHLTHMNHSKAFWDAVEKVMPDYREYRLWLKNNGSTLRTS